MDKAQKRKLEEPMEVEPRSLKTRIERSVKVERLDKVVRTVFNVGSQYFHLAEGEADADMREHAEFIRKMFVKALLSLTKRDRERSERMSKMLKEFSTSPNPCPSCLAVNRHRVDCELLALVIEES